MKTEYKIIGGGVLLTLIIIVGGVWLSSSKGEKEKEKLAKPLMGELVRNEVFVPAVVS